MGSVMLAGSKTKTASWKLHKPEPSTAATHTDSKARSRSPSVSLKLSNSKSGKGASAAKANAQADPVKLDTAAVSEEAGEKVHGSQQAAALSVPPSRLRSRVSSLVKLLLIMQLAHLHSCSRCLPWFKFLIAKSRPVSGHDRLFVSC